MFGYYHRPIFIDVPFKECLTCPEFRLDINELNIEDFMGDDRVVQEYSCKSEKSCIRIIKHFKKVCDEEKGEN